MIELKSCKYIVKNIKKKTKAEGMSKIKEGDIVYFSTKMKDVTGAGNRGCYASKFYIHLEKTEEKYGKSQTLLNRIITECFELEEC